MWSHFRTIVDILLTAFVVYSIGQIVFHVLQNNIRATPSTTDLKVNGFLIGISQTCKHYNTYTHTHTLIYAFHILYAIILRSRLNLEVRTRRTA